jgi:UDP-2,3-diacylglucosamine pyrophosphatase LpxH
MEANVASNHATNGNQVGLGEGVRKGEHMAELSSLSEETKPDQDYNLLIVSDLHLSEGRRPTTKKFSRIEDFFFDEEFRRFLDYHQHHQDSDKAWHLIINGDFLDFLQVTSTDLNTEFLRYLDTNTVEEARIKLSYDRQHLDYGYGCGPKESVYKLWRIMDGHWTFFEGLADFLVGGNRITIIKGNHDADFFYMEVQRAFVTKLRAIYEEALKRRHDPAIAQKLGRLRDTCESGELRFNGWFYHEQNLLWVEHGNQYDHLNCFRDWLSPMLPRIPGYDLRQDELDLPWGSLFVRYLFNKVESSEPLSDHIRPQTKFIFYFLAHQPFAALKFLVTSGRYMLKKMCRSWRKLVPGAYTERDAAQAAALAYLTDQSSISPGQLREIHSMRAQSVLKEDPGNRTWRTIRFLTRFRLMFGVMLIVCPVAWLYLWIRGLFPPADEPDALYQKAAEIASRLNVRYVIMGHSHNTELQPLPTHAGEYFNTGTWTKVFREEELLMEEESEFVFVCGSRENSGADLKLRLMKWNDPTGEPRLVRMLETGAERAATMAGTKSAPQVHAGSAAG